MGRVRWQRECYSLLSLEAGSWLSLGMRCLLGINICERKEEESELGILYCDAGLTKSQTAGQGALGQILLISITLQGPRQHTFVF